MPRPAWTLYAYQLIEPDDQLDLFACREVRVHMVARQLELDTPADRTLCGKLLPAQPRWQPAGTGASARPAAVSRLPETTGGGKARGAPVLVGLSPPGETWRGVTLSFLLLHRTRKDSPECCRAYPLSHCLSPRCFRPAPHRPWNCSSRLRARTSSARSR